MIHSNCTSLYILCSLPSNQPPNPLLQPNIWPWMSATFSSLLHRTAGIIILYIKKYIKFRFSILSQPQNLNFIQIEYVVCLLCMSFPSLRYIYIYTWNPNDLYFWRSIPQNKVFYKQNKGPHLGSRYIYIYKPLPPRGIPPGIRSSKSSAQVTWIQLGSKVRVASPNCNSPGKPFLRWFEPNRDPRRKKNTTKRWDDWKQLPEAGWRIKMQRSFFSGWCVSLNSGWCFRNSWWRNPERKHFWELTWHVGGNRRPVIAAI